MPERPLRVCLVSDEYPPETGWGGIGTYTFNLANGLASAGHTVTVISGSQGPARTIEEGNLTLHRIGFASPAGLAGRTAYAAFRLCLARLPELRRKIEFARAAYGLTRRLHQDRPFDVVEAAEYNANAWFIARSRLAPLVVKLHTPTLFNYRLNELPVTREVRLADRLERGQALRASRRTAPSRRMAEQAAAWLGGRPVQVLPNPIDTDRFTPDGPIRPGPWGTAPYALYTGRLERRKGVHTLLAAFRRIRGQAPDLHLVLAGHDTPTFRLGGRTLTFRAYAAELGLLAGVSERVHFLDRLDRDELPALIRGSRFGVFPSESFENFPYTCLECLSCGRPAVVSDTGGMAEMVEDGESGRIIPGGNVDALGRALRELHGNPDQAAAMGKAARQRVSERFSGPAVTARTVDVYREVTA